MSNAIPDVTIVVGTVYGGSEAIAELAAKMLKRAGHSSRVLLEATVSELEAAEKLLFITSTTGQGDLPQNIIELVDDLEAKTPDFNAKPYGLIAFGDRGYGKTFCRAGKQVNALLARLNCAELMPCLEVDAVEHLDPEEPVVPWLQDFVDEVVTS